MATASERYFSDFQERLIVEAIQKAELQTSGEIRIHVEPICSAPSPVDRAKEIFVQLKMERTQERNGILFYFAHESKKFAIWGDKGIHEKVSQSFWELIKNESLKEFKDNRIVDGLVASILKCGDELRRYFPYQKDDTNELPNEISY